METRNSRGIAKYILVGVPLLVVLLSVLVLVAVKSTTVPVPTFGSEDERADANQPADPNQGPRDRVGRSISTRLSKNASKSGEEWSPVKSRTGTSKTPMF